MRDGGGEYVAGVRRSALLLAVVVLAALAAGNRANHVPSGSSPGPLATRVLVTPPDETVTITVTPTTPLDVCGNARIGPVTQV